MGGDGGPTGDSKIRRRFARAARNQRDFHYYVVDNNTAPTMILHARSVTLLNNVRISVISAGGAARLLN
jgi:hypothetical protein